MKRFVQTLVLIGVLGMGFLQPALSVGNFQVGGTAVAYAEDPAASGSASNTNIEQNLASGSDSVTGQFVCVFGNLEKGTFSGCIIQLLYDFVFTPLQYLAYIAAKFLDFFIAYSINSESYRGVEFIEKGWGILRDLTNILFIFALLYIAFIFVLNKESQAKRLLMNVILVGLAINFSLFLTQVIVDAGNVLAHVFYNEINVVTPPGSPVVSDFGEKQISAAVVSQSNPQQIIGNMEFSSSADTAPIIMLILAASAFSLGLVLMFASMAFLFVGRTVGLIIQMIFAPIAFASFIVPNIPLDQFKFERWFKETLNLSLLAPLFVFFLYLVVLFFNAANNISYPASGGTINLIISILLPYALTWAILKKGTTLTKNLAGEAATLVTSGLNVVGGMAVTAALGAATGGAGLAARASIGRLGAAGAAASAGRTNAVARGINKIGTKLATSDFDFRSTSLAKQFQQRTGVSIGNQLASQGGGYIGSQKRFIETQQKRAEEFSKIGVAERKWDRDIAAKEEAYRNATKINENNTKDKEYKQKFDALENLKKEMEEEKNSGGLTDARKKEFNQKIKDAKAAIAATEKYKEIDEARKAVDVAKKAKKDEEKRRKQKFVDDGLVSRQGLGQLAEISSRSVQEAINKIRGEVDTTGTNFGKATFGTEDKSKKTGTSTTTINQNTTINNSGGAGGAYGQTTTTSSTTTQQKRDTGTPELMTPEQQASDREATQKRAAERQRVEQAMADKNTQADYAAKRAELDAAEQANNEELAKQLKNELDQIQKNIEKISAQQQRQNRQNRSGANYQANPNAGSAAGNITGNQPT